MQGVRNIFVKLAILSSLLLIMLVGTAGAQSLTSAFCSGSQAGASGAIPSTTILSNQSNGETAILSLSVLIMLVMLFITGILYVLSDLINVGVLKNMAKDEFKEILITALIVFIFVGGFGAISAATATSQSGFALAGNTFGRTIFTDDCTYLAVSSINLVAPLFILSIVRSLLQTVYSLKISVEPSYFGFTVMPLQGYNLFDTVLAILEDMVWGFILLNLAGIAMLGLIYGLFPIFLYAGIVLRTFPWTRAAGGAFLGLFIGFYIVFPIILHIMLGGYISGIAASQANPSVTANLPQWVQSIIGQSSSGTPGIFTYAASFLSNLFIFGNQYGLVNGFIYTVIEPALFTFLAIIIALFISFDFAEIMGDLLGAPSLKASGIFSPGRGGIKVI